MYFAYFYDNPNWRYHYFYAVCLAESKEEACEKFQEMADRKGYDSLIYEDNVEEVENSYCIHEQIYVD